MLTVRHMPHCEPYMQTPERTRLWILAALMASNLSSQRTAVRQSVPNNIDTIRIWEIEYLGFDRGLYSGTLYDVLSHLYNEEGFTDATCPIFVKLYKTLAPVSTDDLNIVHVAYESLRVATKVPFKIDDQELSLAISALAKQRYTRNGFLVSIVERSIIHGSFVAVIVPDNGESSADYNTVSSNTTTTTQKEETIMAENNNTPATAQEKADSFKKSLTAVLGMQQTAWKDAAQLRAGEIVVNTLAKIARKGMGVMASAWIGKDEPGNIKNHIFKVVIASLTAVAANMLNHSRWRRLANAAIVAAYTDAMRQVPVEKWLSQAIDSVDIRRAEAVLDGKDTEAIDQSALIAELSARLAAIEAEKAASKK